MISKLFLIVFYCSVSIHCNISFYNDLGKFCSENGFNFITLSTIDEQGLLENEAKRAFVALQKYGLRVRNPNFNNMISELHFNLDTSVILTNTNILKNIEKLLLVLENIAKHRIRKSMLVFTEELSTAQKTELMQVLQNTISGNIWFYLIYHGPENTTEYKNIISLSNNTKTLMQDIKFNKMNKIVNIYNLEVRQNRG